MPVLQSRCLHSSRPPYQRISAIAYIAFVILTVGLVALVGLATLRTNALLAEWPTTQNPLLLPGENVLRGLLIALCVGLGLLSGVPHAVLGWQWGDVLAQLGWGSAAGLVLAGFYIVATRALIAIGGDRLYSSQVIRLITPRRRADFFPLALAMVGVVVMEELLFRSLLIGGMTPLMPAWIAILLSALVFGLMHSAQGVWGMLGVTLGGLALGALFVAADSLLLPVWTHYIVNMAQLVVAYRRGLGTSSPGH